MSTLPNIVTLFSKSFVRFYSTNNFTFQVEFFKPIIYLNSIQNFYKPTTIGSILTLSKPTLTFSIGSNRATYLQTNKFKYNLEKYKFNLNKQKDNDKRIRLTLAIL